MGHSSITEADTAPRSLEVMFSLASLDGEEFRNRIPLGVDKGPMLLV